MLEIGSLVDGKYRILREIGHGGMSIVYMAINEKVNKTWAIKEVRRDGVIDYEAVKQGLIVETDLLKKLKHAHLPSIVDVIENEDTFLIVMDYIEGNSLEKTLLEYGAQSQENVINWAKQLCDVLGYLHSRTPAIIYRDLKPANIMLKPDGNIMVIDFGTAREYKEKNLADTTCLGTVGYAAPEQFGGKGQTDGRTDIYCLGATLYHLVTGLNPSEPPYEIKPIREVNPMLMEGLEKIIQKCTQRNPEQRYQSCAEMLYDLEHIEQGNTFIKKQKIKMGAFITTAACSLLLCVSGISLNVMASQMATDNYENFINDAGKQPDYNEKINLYKQAVAVPNKSGEKDAYIGLIQCYRDNNNEHVFTTDEQAELTRLIKNNKENLMSNPQNYAEVCFETGKLIWYYYSYGNSQDNQITRMITAVDWFDDAYRNCDDNFPYKNMVEVYRDIGMFYRDININIVEASDKGIYKPFFENLKELLERVGSDEAESDMVRLELYEICRSALQQYATKFRGEDISQNELIAMHNQITAYVEKMYKALPESRTIDIENQGRDVQLLVSTYNLLSSTLESIQLAYSSQKEL